MKRFLFNISLMAVLFLSMSTAIWPKHAMACCNCSDEVEDKEDDEWGDKDDGTVAVISKYITDEFIAHRQWYIATFWEDNILPALMLMSEQLSAVAMQQVQIFGSFIDAKHQMETQQIFQTLQARVHKDYHPSVGMCEFGSNAKSLASSERRSEYNALFMSQRSQDRQLGAVNTAGATGQAGDKDSRVIQFRKKFCDPNDNGNDGLSYLCNWDQTQNTTVKIGAADPERMNKDIDYVRTLEDPWTLDVNFTDKTLTNNEEEILALASNLYGNKLFHRPKPDSLRASTDENTPITRVQELYLDSRSVLAKRSVAENSFNAITAMKSEGTPGAREFMLSVLQELGVNGSGDAAKMIGNNPSYYAQMEVLTKKIFQNPDFYTNLYDKPANVDRKGVALQAIGLMQKFDLFKSYLRNEASLSVLLELAVMDLQDEAQNEINDQKSGGGIDKTKVTTP